MTSNCRLRAHGAQLIPVDCKKESLYCTVVLTLFVISVPTNLCLYLFMCASSGCFCIYLAAFLRTRDKY